MKFLKDPETLARVMRLIATGKPMAPDRLGYLKLLRKLDRLFLTVLAKFGACTWAELKEATKPFDDHALPSKITVDDWLTLAHRRGLIELSGADPADPSKRWNLTASGLAKSKGTLSRVRPVARTVGAMLGFAATLAFGSSLLFGELKDVDWGAVIHSEAFLVACITLVYAILLSIIWMASWRVKARVVIGAIEITRVMEQIPGLEIDTETVTAYSKPLTNEGLIGVNSGD
jgi:hypothetical protein